MDALRVEVPVRVWVVGVQPKGVSSRLQSDEAGLVVSCPSVASNRILPNDMLLDIEPLQDSGPRPAALRYDDIRTQDSQFSRYEAAAVLE